MREIGPLREIVNAIKSYPGLTRKAPVRWAAEALVGATDFGRTAVAIGDDASAFVLGKGHLLLAADAIMSSLLEADPVWAGYCSVLVNVNDIFAMGGKPLAMANTIAYDDEERFRLVLRGIKEGCLKFQVPMVGGHTMADASAPALSVSIVGKASRLLTSFDCAVDDAIVLAIDLDGQRHGDFLHWDTTSHKSSREVLRRLGALPLIAQRGLSRAAKDVSNPGILGTIGMLLETSRKGALVDVDRIPKPEGVTWIDWLRMYPGFGFILSVPHPNVAAVRRLLQARKVDAAVIGQVTGERRMVLHRGDEVETLFDFEREAITGISGLKPGDRIQFDFEGDGVKLRPAPSRILKGYGAVPPRRRPEDWRKVRAEIEQAIAEEVDSEG